LPFALIRLLVQFFNNRTGSLHDVGGATHGWQSICAHQERNCRLRQVVRNRTWDAISPVAQVRKQLI
jgi:hypothetical protein